MAEDDPIVQHVRAARQQIAASCGGDAHALFEWAKKIEADCPGRLRGYEREGKPRKQS